MNCLIYLLTPSTVDNWYIMIINIIKRNTGRKENGEKIKNKSTNDNNSLIMKLKIRMKLTTQKA